MLLPLLQKMLKLTCNQMDTGAYFLTSFVHDDTLLTLGSFSNNPCMAQGNMHSVLGTPFTSFIIIFHDIHFTPPCWWTPLNFCRNCCILQAVLFFQLAQAGYIFLLLYANFFTDYIYLFTLPYHAAAPLWYIRAFCPC